MRNFNLAKTTNDIVVQSSKPKIIYHKIRSGEALSIIANKYNCTISEIKKANNLRSVKTTKSVNKTTNNEDNNAISYKF